MGAIVTVGNSGVLSVEQGPSLTLERAAGAITDSAFAWWDASDLTQLFQDTAGNTPVTTDGDPVRRINNKGQTETSPLIASNAADTSTWVENWSGGKGAYNKTGVSVDQILTTSAAGTSGNGWTRAAIFSSNNVTSDQFYGEWVSNGTRSELGSSSTDVAARFGTGGAFFLHSDADVGSDVIVGHVMTWNGGDDAVTSRCSTSPTLVTGTKAFQEMETAQSAIFIRDGSGTRVRCGEWIIWDELLDIADVVSYLEAKWGITFDAIV